MSQKTEHCKICLKKHKKAKIQLDIPRHPITMGGQEDIAYENCKAMRERFDQMGIKHCYYETPGGHTYFSNSLTIVIL